MGGGEWTQRQEYQQQTLNQAYQQTPVKMETIEPTPKPDLFDQAYVYLRTFVPGWMMGTFILIGAMTVGIVRLKKQIKNLIVIWGDLLKGK